jgi:hypothetical protein
MNHTHDPCRCCARFLPTGGQKPHQDGPGRCEGEDRDAHSTDHPCPLFVERGSREAKLLAKSSREVLAELQRRYPAETISRASAVRKQ